MIQQFKILNLYNKNCFLKLHFNITLSDSEFIIHSSFLISVSSTIYFNTYLFQDFSKSASNRKLQGEIKQFRKQ